ncbi:hypothetical protein CL656_05880 [bacterium]|nr:hypothetical protein [bacterium]
MIANCFRMNINQGIETDGKLGRLKPILKQNVDSISSSTIEEISSSLDSKKITTVPIENLETDTYPNWKDHSNTLKDTMLSNFFRKFENSNDPYVIEQIGILKSRLDKIEIKIIDTNQVNAFCVTKTGTIMITTGLLKKIKEYDSEDALAFIIGHEIGHIVYENMERFKNYQSTDKNSQTKNSLNMEFECDKFALELVDSIGLNVKYANLDIFDSSDLKPMDLGILSSHPETNERNKHLKELILSGSYENYQEDKNTFQDLDLEIIILESQSYSEYAESITISSFYNFFENCNSIDDFNSIFDSEQRSFYNNVNKESFEILVKNFKVHNQLTCNTELKTLPNFTENVSRIANFFRMYIDNKNILFALEASQLEKFNGLSDEELVLMMLSSQSFRSFLPINEYVFLTDNLQKSVVKTTGMKMEKSSKFQDNEFVKSLKACLMGNSQELIKFVLGLEKDLLKNIYENSRGNSPIANLLTAAFSSIKNTKITIQSLNTQEYFELLNNLKILNFSFKENGLYFEHTENLLSVLNDLFDSNNQYALEDFFKTHKKQISELIITNIKEGSNELFIKVMNADKNFFYLNNKTNDFLNYFLDLNMKPEGFENIQPQVLDILFSNLNVLRIRLVKEKLEDSFLNKVLTIPQKTYIEKSSVFESSIRESSDKSLKEYIESLVELDFVISEIPFSGILLRFNAKDILDIADLIIDKEFLNKEKLVKILQNSLSEKLNLYRLKGRTFNSNFEEISKFASESELSLNKQECEILFKLLDLKKDWKGIASLADNYFVRLISDDEREEGLIYCESLESFDIPILNHRNENLSNLSIQEVIESKTLTLGDYVYFKIAKEANLLQPESDDSDSKLELIKNLIAKFKRPSCLLDKLICSNLDQDIFDQLDKSKQELLLRLVVKSPIKARMIGKLYYEKYILTCQDFDAKKNMILKCFPKASKYRDELLQNLILSSEFDPSELISLDKDLFTKYNSEFLRNGTILEGTIGSYIRNLSEEDKLFVFKKVIFQDEEIETRSSFTLLEFLSEQSGLGQESINQMMLDKEYREIFINDLINCKRSVLNQENCKTLVDDLFVKLDCKEENPQIMKITKSALSSILLRSSKDKSAKLLNKVTDLLYNQEKDFSKVIKEVFIGLGVIGVKLGQIIASQPFVKEKSPNLYNALSELKDQAEPMDLIEILESIKSNTNLHGKKLQIERILASASIKSVLKAKIDEKDVVLKVLKPNANKYLKESKKELDLIFGDLAPLIQEEFDIEIPDLASEIIEWIQEETDFENETQNLNRMKVDTEKMKLNLNFKFYVPQIKSDLSSFNMLSEDIVPGIPLKNIDDLELKRKIYKDLQLLITQQLFVDGFFHADLHDGNIFYDQETQTVSLIDAGFCSKLSESLQILLLNLIDKKGDINFMIQRYLAENGRLLDSQEFVKISEEVSQESSYFKKLVKIQEFLNSMQGFSAPTELTRTVAGLTKCAHIFDTIDFSLQEIISQVHLARNIYSVSPYFVETQLIKFLKESDHSIARIGNILTGPLKISPANLINYIITIIDKKILEDNLSEISIGDFLEVLDDNPVLIKIKAFCAMSNVEVETAIKVLAGIQESTGNTLADNIINMIKSNLDNPDMISAMLSEFGLGPSEAMQDSEGNQLQSELNSVDDLQKVSLSDDNYSQILEFVITLNFKTLKKINFENLDAGVVKLINSQINTLIAKIEDYEELNQLESSFDNISGNILNRKIQLIENDNFTIFELVNLNESDLTLLKIIDKKLEDYFETFIKIKPIRMSDYPDFYIMKSSNPILDKKILEFLKSKNIDFEYILNLKVRSEIFDSYLENMSLGFTEFRLLENYRDNLSELHYKLLNQIVKIQIENLKNGDFNGSFMYKCEDTPINQEYHRLMYAALDLENLDFIKGAFKNLHSNSLFYYFSKRILLESQPLSNNFNDWLDVLGKYPERIDFQRGIKDFIEESNPPINELIIGFRDYEFMEDAFTNLKKLTLVADKKNNRYIDVYAGLCHIFKVLEKHKSKTDSLLEEVNLINVNVEDFIYAFRKIHDILYYENNFDEIQSEIFEYIKTITFTDAELDDINLPNLNSGCLIQFPNLLKFNKLKIGICGEINLPKAENLNNLEILEGTEIKIETTDFIEDLIKFGLPSFNALKLNQVFQSVYDELEALEIWNQIKDVFSHLGLENFIKLKFKNTLFSKHIELFIKNLNDTNARVKSKIFQERSDGFEDDLYQSDFYSVFSSIASESMDSLSDKEMINLLNRNSDKAYYIDCLLKSLYRRGKLEVFLGNTIDTLIIENQIYGVFNRFAKANLKNLDLIESILAIEDISDKCNVRYICLRHKYLLTGEYIGSLESLESSYTDEELATFTRIKFSGAPRESSLLQKLLIKCPNAEFEFENVESSRQLKLITQLPPELKQNINKITCMIEEFREFELDLSGFTPEIDFEFPNLTKISSISKFKVENCKNFSAPNLKQMRGLLEINFSNQMDVSTLEDIYDLRINCSNSGVTLKLNSLKSISSNLELNGFRNVELLNPETLLFPKGKIQIRYKDEPMEIIKETFWTKLKARLLKDKEGTIKCIDQDLIDRINSEI